MKRIQLFALAAALMMAAACSEPLNEVAEEATPQNEAVATTTDGRTVADVNMERFAEILSKAVAQSRDLRVFFKEQATEKIDNDYNVFYPIAKRKAVGGETMEQMLAKYADDSELAEIQAAVPLLNVHLPELAGSTVADLDPDDEELPVLYNNVMYYDGEPIDTLAADEVPGFNILVVTESSSIRKRSGLSKSASDMALDDEYEYVDVAFKPESKQLSKAAGLVETLSAKYTSNYINNSEIDGIVVSAARNAANNKEAMRAFVYYGMTNMNQTPKKMRRDIHELIFRFKIDASAADHCTDVASAYGCAPIFKGDYVHKGGAVSTKDAIQQLLTGRCYGVRFVMETFSDGECIGSEYVSLKIKPSDLFNLSVKEYKKRHKTSFRHSKYQYIVDTAGFQTKWYYPMDHPNIDSRFHDMKWDLANKDPYKRTITVYIENPCDGQTIEKTVSMSASIVNTQKISSTTSNKTSEAINLGVSKELTGSKKIDYSYTVKHVVPQNSQELVRIPFNFFDNYPIFSVGSSQCWMHSLSSGYVTIDILPISDDFYMNKYRR